MHAFILTSGTKESRNQYLSALMTPQTEFIHIFAEKSTLSIKQIKDLSTPLSITPRLPRIVWIEEANLLTIPAQNALLKMLEEPPELTTFYLTCNSSSSLLPTIRSRCAHQALKRLRNASRNEVVWETQLPLLKNIMSLSPGDRLALITKRDRSESLIWLTQIEQALRDKLHDSSLTRTGTLTLAKIARLACLTHLQLESNCSVSLTTQNFLLSLPKTK